MKTTKLIFFAGLFIAWAFLATLFIAGFNMVERNSLSNTVSGKNVSNDNSINNNLVLDLNEIAKHNSASDCWMIINNKVYDITPYINSHPGGESVLSR